MSECTPWYDVVVRWKQSRGGEEAVIDGMQVEEERKYKHQTNSNMQYIVIEGKIDKSIPKTGNMSSRSVGSSKKWFACCLSTAKIEDRSRHFGCPPWAETSTQK